MTSVQPRPQPQANGMARMTASSGTNENPYTAIWAAIPRSPSRIGFGPADLPSTGPFGSALAGAVAVAVADWRGVTGNQSFRATTMSGVAGLHQTVPGHPSGRDDFRHCLHAVMRLVGDRRGMMSAQQSAVV